jgi:hypothetical protein
MTDDDGAKSDARLHAREQVTQPGKVLRLSSMARALSAALRRDDDELGDRARDRAKTTYQSSLRELRPLLSDDLRNELDALVGPLVRDTDLTGAELRVAEAQLTGWLDGLFQGLHASALTQQVARVADQRSSDSSASGDDAYL